MLIVVVSMTAVSGDGPEDPRLMTIASDASTEFVATTLGASTSTDLFGASVAHKKEPCTVTSLPAILLADLPFVCSNLHSGYILGTSASAAKFSNDSHLSSISVTTSAKPSETSAGAMGDVTTTSVHDSMTARQSSNVNVQNQQQIVSASLQQFSAASTASVSVSPPVTSVPNAEETTSRPIAVGSTAAPSSPKVTNEPVPTSTFSYSTAVAATSGVSPASSTTAAQATVLGVTAAPVNTAQATVFTGTIGTTFYTSSAATTTVDGEPAVLRFGNTSSDREANRDHGVGSSVTLTGVGGITILPASLTAADVDDGVTVGVGGRNGNSNGGSSITVVPTATISMNSERGEESNDVDGARVASHSLVVSAASDESVLAAVVNNGTDGQHIDIGGIVEDDNQVHDAASAAVVVQHHSLSEQQQHLQQIQQQQLQLQQQHSTMTMTTTTTTTIRDMDIIHVQWLIDNYETAEGVSLPRSTLYSHYLRHCAENNLDPVNAASFGKLIRSVFLGLRTRRLGTRGNSKYHYYGIRVKPTSPLAGLLVNDNANDSDSSNPPSLFTSSPHQHHQHHHHHHHHHHHQVHDHPSLSTSAGTSIVCGGGSATFSRSGGSAHQNEAGNSTASVSNGGKQQIVTLAGGVKRNADGAPAGAGVGSGSPEVKPKLEEDVAAAASSDGGGAGGAASVSDDTVSVADVGLAGSRSFLGDPSHALPSQLMMVLISGDGEFMEEREAYNFTLSYREYCEALLELVVQLQFAKVACLWQHFFVTNPANGEEEKRREHLHHVLTSPSVLTFLRTTDTQFYQNLVHVLIPDVLRPVPAALTQAIRNFAKNIEQWLSFAMQDCPEDARKIKLSVANAFAQTLRRYTSLNHLAQAARAVLQNQFQIQQMLADLNKVDFRNVHEQAAWVCDCDAGLVRQIEQEFKRQLERQGTLAEWANWLEQIVDRVLLLLEQQLQQQVQSNIDTVNAPAGAGVDIVKASRKFLLTWSFYSSMVIRDLTLRSASSFGSFHLIRLLFDEYMFYLVEQKVAQALDKAPLSLGEDLLTQSNGAFGGVFDPTQYEVVLPDGCEPAPQLVGGDGTPGSSDKQMAQPPPS